MLIRLDRGRRISGRVVDEEGRPVPGPGRLNIYPSGNPSGAPTAVTSANAEGRFRTQPLPFGRYDLLTDGFEGHVQTRLAGVQPGGPDVTVVVTRGQPIGGRVLDEEGRRVPAGIGVAADAEGERASLPGRYGIAYTDETGAFRIGALGPHRFTLRAGGGGAGYVGTRAAEGVAAGAADVVLTVKRGVPVRGTVADAEGRPVLTVLSLWASGGPATGLSWWTTVSEGSFVFAGLPAGEIALHTYSGGKYVALGRFDTREGEWRVVLPRE